MSPVSAKQRDALAIGALTIACLLLRVPSLDRLTLNPDESQYEATASYLVGTQTSALELPYFIPGVFGVFKVMARIFGIYPMFETRILVQLLCLGMAILIYRLVRRETNCWCGLLGGMIFLHQAMLYEGLTVNREWFAGAMILGGVTISMAALRESPTRRGWLLFAAGLVCGTALWFKLQAAFMVLAVPGLLLWLALLERRPAAALRTIGPHFLGGTLSGLGFMLPLYLSGTLEELLSYLHSSWSLYVVGNEEVVQQAADGTATFYFGRFYWDQPHRIILITTFLFALLCIGAALRDLVKDPKRTRFLTRPGVLIFVAYLVAAMLSVKLGNRFFSHYYLLMLPPVAALAGLATFHFTSGEWKDGRGRWIVPGFFVILLVDRFFFTAGFVPMIRKLWPGYAAEVFYGLLVLAAAAFWLVRPLRRAGPAIAALLCLQTGTLIVEQQATPTPATMSHKTPGFAELTVHLEERSNPGDLLFVWGWAPEIYSLARLEAASHVTMCQFIVNDYEAAAHAGTIDPWWAAMMMRDLEERRPRFVVDAGDRSWATTQPSVYDLDNYPDFEFVKMLERDYTLTLRLDDCDVYERRDAAGPL